MLDLCWAIQRRLFDLARHDPIAALEIVCNIAEDTIEILRSVRTMALHEICFAAAAVLGSEAWLDAPGEAAVSIVAAPLALNERLILDAALRWIDRNYRADVPGDGAAGVGVKRKLSDLESSATADAAQDASKAFAILLLHCISAGGLTFADIHERIAALDFISKADLVALGRAKVSCGPANADMGAAARPAFASRLRIVADADRQLGSRDKTASNDVDVCSFPSPFCPTEVSYMLAKQPAEQLMWKIGLNMLSRSTGWHEDASLRASTCVDEFVHQVVEADFSSTDNEVCVLIETKVSRKGSHKLLDRITIQFEPDLMTKPGHSPTFRVIEMHGERAVSLPAYALETHEGLVTFQPLCSDAASSLISIYDSRSQSPADTWTVRVARRRGPGASVAGDTTISFLINGICMWSACIPKLCIEVAAKLHFTPEAWDYRATITSHGKRSWQYVAHVDKS